MCPAGICSIFSNNPGSDLDIKTCPARICSIFSNYPGSDLDIKTCPGLVLSLDLTYIKLYFVQTHQHLK